MIKSNLKYQYLNEVCYQGGQLFTGYLMGFSPFVKSLGVEVLSEHHLQSGISSLNTDEISPAYPSSTFGSATEQVFINIVIMTWPGAFAETNGSNIWQQTSEANSGAFSCACHTRIYLMAFCPANLHLPWQTKELQSVDETADTWKSWPPLQSGSCRIMEAYGATLLVVMLGYSQMVGRGRKRAERLSCRQFCPPLCPCLPKSMRKYRPTSWIKKIWSFSSYSLPWLQYNRRPKVKN